MVFNARGGDDYQTIFWPFIYIYLFKLEHFSEHVRRAGGDKSVIDTSDELGVKLKSVVDTALEVFTVDPDLLTYSMSV